MRRFMVGPFPVLLPGPARQRAGTAGLCDGNSGFRRQYLSLTPDVGPHHH
jgi:hypothetical protein